MRGESELTFGKWSLIPAPKLDFDMFAVHGDDHQGRKVWMLKVVSENHQLSNCSVMASLVTASDPARFAATSSTAPAPKLAPFNPTSVTAQSSALAMLSLTPSDVLYDLGCGDGRFIFAALLSCPSLLKCVGVEYDKLYYDRCQTTLSALPPAQGKVEFLHADVSQTDFSDATAIFVYLVPEGLKIIEKKLHDTLRSGARIASYMFSVPGLKPVR